MKKLSVVSRQSSAIKYQPAVYIRESSVITKTMILIIGLLLFTIHFSLSAAYADEIRSKAAAIMEESTGRIMYGKNPNLKLPPASTAKLVSAMVVLDRVNVDEVVTISEKAANASPIKANFKAGEKVTVKTLLYAALIRSANDAAFALAETVAGSEEKFAELMNRKVLALGMSDTRFINSSGLPGQGQFTTVYDLARIMRHAMRYPIIRDIINTRASYATTEDGRTIFLKNINRLLWVDDSMIGGKTGYTRDARHCFVCAGEHGGDVVIVAVLGAPSREVLWKESEALMEKGFAIKDRKEEPVIYFTKADYDGSVQKASYKVKAPDVKKASYKKKNKYLKAKLNKGKANKKNKRQKANNANIAFKGNGGNKG